MGIYTNTRDVEKHSVEWDRCRLQIETDFNYWDMETRDSQSVI